MYRYLDRPACDLFPVDRLLVWSMRNWVAAVSSGRCPCSALGPVLTGRGLADMVADFNMTMLIINNEGQARLRFGALGRTTVCDDEARLLAFFAAAGNGTNAQLRRLADQLVQPAAVGNLVTAVERMTATLSTVPMVWDAPGSRSLEP
jgi:hypothetical protein